MPDKKPNPVDAVCNEPHPRRREANCKLYAGHVGQHARDWVYGKLVNLRWDAPVVEPEPVCGIAGCEGKHHPQDHNAAVEPEAQPKPFLVLVPDPHDDSRWTIHSRWDSARKASFRAGRLVSTPTRVVHEDLHDPAPAVEPEANVWPLDPRVLTSAPAVEPEQCKWAGDPTVGRTCGDPDCEFPHPPDEPEQPTCPYPGCTSPNDPHEHAGRSFTRRVTPADTGACATPETCCGEDDCGQPVASKAQRDYTACDGLCVPDECVCPIREQRTAEVKAAVAAERERIVAQLREARWEDAADMIEGAQTNA